jgi:TIGR03009 family protein
MKRVFGAWIGSVLAAIIGGASCGTAAGQVPAGSYGAPETQRAAGPDQPVVPQYPTIERRVPQVQAAPGQDSVYGSRRENPRGNAGVLQPIPPAGAPYGNGSPPASAPGNLAPGGSLPPAAAHGTLPAAPAAPQVPFVLTWEEQRQLDQMLTAWEQRNREIRRFECKLTRWEYTAFNNGTVPQPDEGELKYAAPDKGLFRVDGKRPEQWMCDGRSVFQYDYTTNPRKVKEYQLPPEVQGKGITDGPLPFVFGAEANKLKQRYFLRLVTPRDVQGQIWLEARPRFLRDAQDFHKAELILKSDGMVPFAIQLYLPGGKEHTVYQFEKVVINRRPLLIEPDPFRASVPWGWQKEVERPPQAQPAQAPAAAPAQAGRTPYRR